MSQLSDDELIAIIKTEPWFKESQRKRGEAQILELGRATGSFADALAHAMQSTHALQRETTTKISLAAELSANAYRNRVQRIHVLRRGLKEKLDHFTTRPLRYLRPSAATLEHCDDTAREAWDALSHRIEQELLPDAESCLAALDRIEKRLIERNKGGLNHEETRP